MRRLIVAGCVVFGVALAAATALRRIPAGAAAWNPATGELRQAESGGLILPRWRWREARGGALQCDLDAPSGEGARVGVRLTIAAPPTRLRLDPAATPTDGLASVTSAAVRAAIAATRLECLAGIAQAGCPDAPEERIAAGVADRLGIATAAVAAAISPDAEAIAAARRAALAKRFGTPARRVLVVGWDGADWEVLEPLAARGVMPNLARLMAQGAWGELRSFTPLLSPLIWTTMATGLGPEEHGILDFVEVDPESGQRVPITGRQRKVPALWNMASAVGLDVAVSGWWATWPAETVHGVMISDRLFHMNEDASGSPPAETVVFPAQMEPRYRELARRADEETDATAVRALLPVSAEACSKAFAEGRGMADPIDGFRRILVGTRTYLGAALDAAETRPALTMAYCIGTDEIGHVLSPYLPAPLPGADPAFSTQARIGVERYFAVVDRWLGRLLATCPTDECAVVLVSDHGFKWKFSATGRDDRPRDFSGVAAATAALWHRPMGVFVLAGSGVGRVGKVADPPSVFDVAPTVAALLGLPPGVGWRGRPLPGAPRPAGDPLDWTALVPPESYRPGGVSARPSPEYIAQLKALGYIEGGEGSGTGRGPTEGELNNLGLVHLEAKRFEQAEKAFRDAIARNPSYPSPHYNLRRLYFETGRYDTADAELWQAVELGLRDGAGAASRAVTDYERQERDDLAARLLGQAVRRFPEHAGLAIRNLALLVRLGQCAEAVPFGTAAADRFADNPDVHAFLGLAAACAGDAGLARRSLERSLRIKPDQPELRRALGALPPG
ncbi:MAG: alkaline phosphatase family protein [Acidobacteriota bacterium]